MQRNVAGLQYASDVSSHAMPDAEHDMPIGTTAGKQRAEEQKQMAQVTHGWIQNGVIFSHARVNQPFFCEFETEPVEMILIVASATL